MFCFVFSPEGADVLKRKHASTDNRNLDFVSVVARSYQAQLMLLEFFSSCCG